MDWIRKIFTKTTEKNNKESSNPEVVFHGGCLGCSMQKKKGISYCTGCMYFEGNWDLPDLNDQHQREKERMDKIRDKARKIANQNPQ